MKLTNVPEILLASFCLVWSDLKSLGKFDSAMCSQNGRENYFNAIRFGKQSLEQFVTIGNNDFSKMFHNWLLTRGVTLNRVKFATLYYSGNLIARKWLASGIQELNTTERILNLRFDNIDFHYNNGSGIKKARFNQFPELQQSVCNLINQCSSLQSLQFVNCGICEGTLMTCLEVSDLPVNELIIIDEKADDDDDSGKVLLVNSLMEFKSLSLLKLQFKADRHLVHLDQVEIVSLLKLNQNLTHLDLKKVLIVDDSFLNSLSMSCKALKQFRCIFESGSTCGYPTATAIAEYLQAPHDLQIFDLESKDHFDLTDGTITDNPSAGEFLIEFDKTGDVTALVQCSKLTIKSIFTGLIKKLVSMKVFASGNGSRRCRQNDCVHILRGDELVEYILNL